MDARVSCPQSKTQSQNLHILMEPCLGQKCLLLIRKVLLILFTRNPLWISVNVCLKLSDDFSFDAVILSKMGKMFLESQNWKKNPFAHREKVMEWKSIFVKFFANAQVRFLASTCMVLESCPKTAGCSHLIVRFFRPTYQTAANVRSNRFLFLTKNFFVHLQGNSTQVCLGLSATTSKTLITNSPSCTTSPNQGKYGTTWRFVRTLHFFRRDIRFIGLRLVTPLNDSSCRLCADQVSKAPQNKRIGAWQTCIDNTRQNRKRKLQVHLVRTDRKTPSLVAFERESTNPESENFDHQFFPLKTWNLFVNLFFWVFLNNPDDTCNACLPFSCIAHR